MSEKKPTEFTSAHDKMFVMKSRKFQGMLNTEDFWWYAISRLKAGQQDIAEIVIGYEQEYVKTGTLFRAE